MDNMGQVGVELSVRAPWEMGTAGGAEGLGPYCGALRAGDLYGGAPALTIMQGRAPVIFQIDFPAVPWLSLRGWQLRLKAVLDVLGALILLLSIAPLFLLAALLIKATSPGPVFFRQQRLGLYQRPFWIWKFRTMTVGAEKEEQERMGARQGVFFKAGATARVTPVGAFLRKYSIDELPQLLNVLKGEMSLVGPRPIQPFELRRFGEWACLRRFSMKPGLTCIWQVSGRSNTTDQERMRYDLQYVDSWSLWLDLDLLLQTVPAVVKAEGAV